MVESPADVTELVRRELALVRDDVVRDALLAQLLQPEVHLRNWDYGAAEERYPCWTVAKDPACDLAIVYSEHGHGPGSPWGLVSLSNLWFGMDAGWFLHLEDAFVDSSMAADLEIWNVVDPQGAVVHASLPFDEAFRRRDQLDASRVRPVHRVVYRNAKPGGVP
jgi:hypothetical protein